MDEPDIVQKTIAERRSIFPPAFTNERVADELIEQMLESANWAPTHKLTEPWRFYVIRDAALIRLGDFLAEQYRIDPKGGEFRQKKYDSIKSKVARSSAVILICMQRDKEERIPEWEECASVAMSVQNMWLTGWSLGVGGYWSSPPYRNAMTDFVEMNPGEQCLGFFYLGHFNQNDVTPKRTPWHDKAQWIRS